MTRLIGLLSDSWPGNKKMFSVPHSPQTTIGNFFFFNLFNSFNYATSENKTTAIGFRSDSDSKNGLNVCESEKEKKGKVFICVSSDILSFPFLCLLSIHHFTERKKIISSFGRWWTLCKVSVIEFWGVFFPLRGSTMLEFVSSLENVILSLFFVF